MDDRGIVDWQIQRPARAFKRVAIRCSHGFPAVTEQHAVTDDGTPFPTTFWLTCPWLVAAVSRIEAAGGVERFTEAVRADPELRRSLVAADAEQRRIRPEAPLGIGGSRNPEKLKCLHAHVAFALARPGYELGDRVLAEVSERWCPDARCAAAPAATRQ